MKASFLPLLICPVCKNSDLLLSIHQQNEIEIRKGAITCTNCATVMDIRQGIVDAFMVAAPQVVQEADGWDRVIKEEFSYNEFQDEWLLALPFLTEDLVLNVDQMVHWRQHGRHLFRFIDRFDWDGKVALEIGAGRCWCVAELRRRGALPIALDIVTRKYVGLESADVWIYEASLYFERIKGDMHHLPLGPDTCDYVLTTASLHHTDRLDTALAEIARVLKPRGHAIFVNEPVTPDGQEKPDLSESDEVLHGIIESRPHFSEWMQAFEKAGFYVVSLEKKDGMHICLRKGLRFFLQIAPNGPPELYGQQKVSRWLILELRFRENYSMLKIKIAGLVHRAPSAPRYYWQKIARATREE